MAGTKIPGGGGRGRLNLMLHCHHQNDSCIKMGSDVSHFNVSLIVRDKVIKQFQLLKREESQRGTKRNSTRALLLTSLKPYR